MRDTVFFDLDETLLDRTGSLRAFATWQAEGMLRNSVKDESEFCRRFLELDSNGSVWKNQVYSSLVQEFQITEWSVAELLLSYELCFSGFCKLFPGAESALASLHKKGYKLGLISNGKSPFQERNFDALGVSDLFRAVVVSEAVGVRKPESEIFIGACDVLETTPQKAIFIGDNPSADIDGANAVGMYTIYMPRHQGQECREANAVCTDYRDLLGIVEKST